MIHEKPADEKFSHAAVSYEHPSKHEGKYCDGCQHYIEAVPPRCEGVKSPIYAADYCKRFEKAVKSKSNSEDIS